MNTETTPVQTPQPTVTAIRVVLHLCLAILLTYSLVTQGEIFIPFFLILWIVGLRLGLRFKSQSYSRFNGWNVFALHASICAIGVILALNGPGKTAEILMGQEVTLPKTRMTISELRDHMKEYRRDAYPTSVSFYSSGEESEAKEDELVLLFPSTKLPFREFVNTLKEQGDYTGRFLSCGNCSSLLKGESCNFGYSLSKNNRD